MASFFSNTFYVTDFADYNKKFFPNTDRYVDFIFLQMRKAKSDYKAKNFLFIAVAFYDDFSFIDNPLCCNNIYCLKI